MMNEVKQSVELLITVCSVQRSPWMPPSLPADSYKAGETKFSVFIRYGHTGKDNFTFFRQNLDFSWRCFNAVLVVWLTGEDNNNEHRAPMMESIKSFDCGHRDKTSLQCFISVFSDANLGSTDGFIQADASNRTSRLQTAPLWVWSALMVDLYHMLSCSRCPLCRAAGIISFTCNVSLQGRAVGLVISCSITQEACCCCCCCCCWCWDADLINIISASVEPDEAAVWLLVWVQITVMLPSGAVSESSASGGGDDEEVWSASIFVSWLHITAPGLWT